MKSIDNMREYVLTAPSICSTTRAILVCYIDEIDKEVEEAREREYRNGREDAGDAAEFADRLCRASERREDVTLWGVDYTPLPVDADGVPIHVGDVMDGVDKYDTLKEVTGEVITIHFDSMGDSKVETSVGLRVWAENGKSYHTSYIDPYASVYRHHHAPTVEDVLEEFVARWMETHHDDIPALKAKYAAKLRLKED